MVSEKTLVDIMIKRSHF